MIRVTVYLPILALSAAAITHAAEPERVTRLGSERLRQVGPIKAVAYSPDGKQLATTSEKVVYLWDAADGRRRFTIPMNQHVFELAFADGGRTLLAEADDNVAKATDLYRIDPATGKVLDKKRVFDGQVNPARFSPDGRWLLLMPCEYARGYQVADTATGKIAWGQPLEGDRGHASHAFRPDGKVLAVGENKGRILLRDLATGHVLTEFRLPDGFGYAMTFSPDGADLVVHVYRKEGHRIVRIAADTGEERWNRPTTDLAQHLTFSADGSAVRYLQIGDAGDYLRWKWLDARTGKPLDRAMTTDYGNALATRPDRKVLAIGGYAGFVSQWDLETGRRIESASAEPPEDVTALRFNADGSKLRGWARGWYEWDVKTGTQTRLTPDIDRWMARDLAVSDDQKWLARVGDRDKQYAGPLEFVDLATGRMKPAAMPKGRYFPIRFAPDGRLIVADDGAVRVVDPATGKPTVAIPWQRHRKPVMITDDGKQAVTVDPVADHLHGTRWDLTTGKATSAWEAVFQNPFRGDAGLSWAGYLSPDGRALGLTFYLSYLGDPEGHALLLDARTGRVVRQWKEQEVQAGWEFSRGGRQFVVFPTRQGVEVRETATGGRRLTGLGKIPGLRWSLRASAFSPDGGTLVLAHSPGPVLVWDLIGKPTGKWADETPDRLMESLSAEDAERAFAAIRHLRHFPAETVAFLKARVRPPTVPTAEWVARHIQDLDAPQFRDRERATADLAAVGELVAAQLQAALKTASAEARPRLEGLLDRATGPAPEKLRAIRACEVLEGIGSPQAREVLAAWAKGPAGATLTREAGEPLGRLAATR